MMLHPHFNPTIHFLKLDLLIARWVDVYGQLLIRRIGGNDLFDMGCIHRAD